MVEIFISSNDNSTACQKYLNSMKIFCFSYDDLKLALHKSMKLINIMGTKILS